jgi:carboxypeptidase family protein/Big-like domain-containing protein/all-beta uncharacterized protein
VSASILSRCLRRSTIACLAIAIAACSSNKSSEPTTPTTPTPTVGSVAVTGSAPFVGLTAQFTATATLSNNTTQNVTSQATWQSSNTALATVNSAGVVTGVSPGEVDIIATYQSVAGRMRVTIAPSTFSLTGVVTDATSGGVLPNIAVQVASGPSIGLSARTDAAGAYTLAGVQAGAATVTASAAGYESQTKGVTIVGSTRLDFVLVRTPGCAYTLSVTSQNVPAAGGTFNFTATSNDTCTWTASTSTPWITLGATSGSTPATITYSAAANPTIGQRVGSIRVSWTGGFADLTVTQGAAACSFTLNPQSGSFAAAGGNGTFTVTPSDAACSWTGVSDSPWLTIASGQSGTGPGTVSYSVQSYAGTGPRVGSITITGTQSGIRGFPVTQQPPP